MGIATYVPVGRVSSTTRGTKVFTSSLSTPSRTRPTRNPQKDRVSEDTSHSPLGLLRPPPVGPLGGTPSVRHTLRLSVPHCCGGNFGIPVANLRSRRYRSTHWNSFQERRGDKITYIVPIININEVSTRLYSII